MAVDIRAGANARSNLIDYRKMRQKPLSVGPFGKYHSPRRNPSIGTVAPTVPRHDEGTASTPIDGTHAVDRRTICLREP